MMNNQLESYQIDSLKQIMKKLVFRKMVFPVAFICFSLSWGILGNLANGYYKECLLVLLFLLVINFPFLLLYMFRNLMLRKELQYEFNTVEYVKNAYRYGLYVRFSGDNQNKNVSAMFDWKEGDKVV